MTVRRTMLPRAPGGVHHHREPAPIATPKHGVATLRRFPISKPIWLLDFDGVLNAISKRPPTHVWPRDTWVVTEAKGREGVLWPILAAKPVLAFIREIHETGLAEIRWHSTWQQDTVNLSEALDLPVFPIQPAPEFEDWNRG